MTWKEFKELVEIESGVKDDMQIYFIDTRKFPDKNNMYVSIDNEDNTFVVFAQ